MTILAERRQLVTGLCLVLRCYARSACGLTRSLTEEIDLTRGGASKLLAASIVINRICVMVVPSVAHRQQPDNRQCSAQKLDGQQLFVEHQPAT